MYTVNIMLFTRLTFLGFGQGPRACLGMRFALLEMKVGLANILRRYNIVPCEKTVAELVPSPKSILGMNAEGVWVRFEARTLKQPL